MNDVVSDGGVVKYSRSPGLGSGWRRRLGKGALTWPPLGFILASVALRKKTIMAHITEAGAHACGSHVAPNTAEPHNDPGRWRSRPMQEDPRTQNK